MTLYSMDHDSYLSMTGWSSVYLKNLTFGYLFIKKNNYRKRDEAICPVKMFMKRKNNKAIKKLII